MTAGLPSLSRRGVLALLVVVLLGAFGLRVWDLNAASVWHDEAWSIRAVRDPINTPDDKTPFLYYSVVHFLWLGAGETPLALRYGSVLLDVLTVACAARLARRWIGRDAAWLAAVLFALSPLLWAYAREVRAYVGVTLLTVVLLDLAERMLAARGRFPWRAWGALLAAELALLYTHNLSVPVVGWLNITLGAVWLWERQWRTLVIWGAGQAALLVAYLPWVLDQAPSGTPLNSPPAVNLQLVWDIWQGLFAPVPAQLGHDNALMIASAAFGVVTLLCTLVVVFYRTDYRALLVLSQVVLLPALSVIELHIAHIDFHPRYFIPVVPATVVIVVMGVYSVPRCWEMVRSLAIPAVVAVVFAVSAASFTGLFTKEAYQHDNFRAIAEYYATLPEEAVIVIPYGWEPALEVYYAEKTGIQAEILGIDLHSSVDEAVAAINAALMAREGPVQVELLTWYQLPADWRGMYPCLLEAVGTPTDSLTVYGLSTQGYVVDDTIQWQSANGTAAEYGILTLDPVAQISGHERVCVHTTWTVERTTKSDWRVAARLVTIEPNGWDIARSDADLRSEEQVPTSDLAVGDQVEAFNVLRFPAGSPPGEYAIQVGVYSTQQPSGLDRLQNGVPAGRSLDLATTELNHPADAENIRTPREPMDVTVTDGVVLAGTSQHAETLNPGQEFRVTLHWRVDDARCCAEQPYTAANLTLRGDEWELAQPVRVYAPASLDWHAFRIPPEASSPVVLSIEPASGEPVVLATYTLEETDHLFAPPPIDVPVDAAFGSWAVLAGGVAEPLTVTPEEELRLTLIWRAEEASAASYRVFTHLLDPDNHVIAQHDGYPANGTRLTTSWVPGEYVMDVHELEFLEEGRAYRGPARIEVGLYNPDSGARVLVSGGADSVVLPLEIMVQ